MSRTSSTTRSEEHTSELQSRQYLVCRLLLEKKKKQRKRDHTSHVVHPYRARRSARARCVLPISAHCARVRPTVPFSCDVCLFFFLNDAAPPEISPFPLPDALPI